MLYAVFNGHGMFIALATLLSATVGFIVYKQAPESSEHRALKGFFGASVTGVVSLTLWSTGSPVHQPRVCVVNRDLIEPFTTDQGLLNAGLFLPVGLLGVLATRKVVGTVAFGVLLTFAIETLQGSLTFLGRGCDSSDLVMNSLGVVAGAVAGWAVTVLEKPRAGFLHAWRARSTYAAVSTVTALALVWAVAIEPQVVDRTLGIGRADAAQEAAIRAVVDESFDGYYKVSRVDFAAGPDGTGTVMAQFSGGGSAELRWPGRDTFQAYLDMTSTGEPSGYPLPGAKASPVDEQQAQEIAGAYAARHASWGLRDARPRTTKVDANAELGWMTSWRRHDANGVLMPMRLDIQVDRGGLVTQIVMTNIPDPPLPSPPRVRKEGAIAALLNANKQDVAKPPAATAVLNRTLPDGTGPQLLSERDEEGWIILAFTYIPRRHPDLAPGSPDLPAVLDTVAALHAPLTPCPYPHAPAFTAHPVVAHAADHHHAMTGDALLHCDIRVDNMLLGTRPPSAASSAAASPTAPASASPARSSPGCADSSDAGGASADRVTEGVLTRASHGCHSRMSSNAHAWGAPMPIIPSSR